MKETRLVWGRVLREANAFLRRWSDPLTCRERGDLAQDAALVAWQRAPAQRDPGRLAAFVRTVARRLRSRTLRLSLRGSGAELSGSDPGSWPEASLEEDACVRVGRELVPVDWLLGPLTACLEQLSDVNRQLLLGFYEGFSCSELSDRFGLTEDAVKVRLHRGRRFLRRRLEVVARAAGCFES